MNLRTYLPITIFIILIILSFYIIQPLLTAIFLGALLAYLFYPLYNRMPKRNLSALLTCFLALLIIIIPAFFFFKTLVTESYLLFILIKQKLSTGFFINCEHSFCQWTQGVVDNHQVSHHIKDLAKSFTTWMFQKSSELLISIPKLLVNLFIIFFTMFYFLTDGKKVINNFNKYLNMHRRKYLIVLKRFKEIMHGVVFGYLMVAFIQGLFAMLGFLLFGVPSPFFWGTIVALLALVPVLGSTLIWLPAAIIMVMNGVIQNSNLLIFKGIGLAIYFILFVSSVDNIMRPIIMGNRAKAHPAVIMLGIFGGIYLFGILGVLIGPLVLSLVVVLAEIYLGPTEEK